MVTPGAVARPQVVAECHPVDELRQRAVAATTHPGRAGATAKRRLTRHVVKAGRRKIVVARRALAKVVMIRVVATALRAMAHHAVAQPRRVVATLVHRLPQVLARAIAARHRLADAAAMVTAVEAVATAVVAAATVAITVADPVVVAQVMVVGAAPAATADKLMPHRAHAGASVANPRKVALAAAVMVRAAAILATTVARLRRDQRIAVATMRAVLTEARRVPVVGVAVAAGAIVMV